MQCRLPQCLLVDQFTETSASPIGYDSRHANLPRKVARSHCLGSGLHSPHRLQHPAGDGGTTNNSCAAGGGVRRTGPAREPRWRSNLDNSISVRTEL